MNDKDVLLKFDSAFAILRTPSLSELARRVLIHIALETPYAENRHREGLRELFPRLNDNEVIQCCDAIRAIEAKG